MLIPYAAGQRLKWMVTMKLNDYIGLVQVARRRLRSEGDYREFQTFQACLVLDYLAQHGVAVQGLVLDLGSGIAGYSLEFARRGAHVISVDLVQPRFSSPDQMSQVQASGLAIPLQDESVNIVFCASLIEHVAEPATLLAEAERILRKGGMCYFSFPPYYSPMGGHEFSPFHYLGERLALRLVHRRRTLADWAGQLYDVPHQVQSFSELYRGWGLYKMTIGKFRCLLGHTGFECLDMSTRYMPVSFVRWPLLGEIMTWHAQFLHLKPQQ